MSPLPVRWPYFVPLLRTLKTGRYRADSFTMTGGFKDHINPPPVIRQAHQYPHPTTTYLSTGLVGTNH